VAETIDLARYAHTRAARASTGTADLPVALAPRVTDQRSLADAKVAVGGTLVDYSRMYGGEQDSLMGRFFDVSHRLGDLLVEARGMLDQGDSFSADDRLTLAKATATELFMVRIASDAIALVALKILQVLSSVEVITDGPERLIAVEIALARIRMSPLMSFEQASDVVDPLEEFAEDIIGYGPLSEALVNE
jgi:hypothetical protein